MNNYKVEMDGIHIMIFSQGGRNRLTIDMDEVDWKKVFREIIKALLEDVV